jgi:hypothetical protein
MKEGSSSEFLYMVKSGIFELSKRLKRAQLDQIDHRAYLSDGSVKYSKLPETIKIIMQDKVLA